MLCALLVIAAFSASASAAVSGFGSEGEFAGQFTQPFGVAVAQGGDVYLVDGQNNRVERWTSEGTFLSAWGWGVADGVTPAYQVCEASCFAGFAGSGSGQLGENAGGVAVDNSLGASGGDVYVVDAQNRRVEKFTAAGEFLLMFGGEVNQTKDGAAGATVAEKDLCAAGTGDVCKAGVSGANPGEFESLGANGVAVGSTGTVYVGDPGRVQRFSPAGVLEGQVPIAGAGSVEALAVDSAKDLYVAAEGLAGVHKYDGAGVELPGEPRDAGGPENRSIAVGPSDELFVNSATGRLLEYTPSGALALSLPEGGGSPGEGIAFGVGKNALYVLHPGFVGVRPVPSPGPVVVEGSEAASELQPTSATVNATVNPEGAPAEYHFEHGTTTSYGETTAISAPLDAVNEVQSVTVAATGGGFTLAFKGEPSTEVPFNATAAEVQAALDGTPGLGAGQVAVSGEPGGPWSVQFTGALAGQDVPQLTAGPANLTGPEPSAVVSTTTPGISLFDDRAASAAIKELQPSTTYHFRVVVTNAASQTSAGPDQTFTTLPAVSIDSESVSQVTATSAKLSTELNAHGIATEYHFEYGRTTAYEEGPAPVPDAAAGSGTADVASPPLLVQGLSPGVTYHYRVLAHNTLGTVTGPDHTFVTQPPQTRQLLDGRAWEQVSPPDKHGVSLEAITEEGGLIQAAEDGSGLAYIARAPIDTEPAGNRSIAETQLLARRGLGGWSTQDIATKHEGVTGLTLGHLSEYQLFSGDLSAGFVQPEGATPLAEQATERTPYLRESSAGAYVPLLYPGNVPEGTKFGGEEGKPEQFSGGVNFVTATPDGSHAILSSPVALTEGLATGGQPSLYEWSSGALTLVSILPNEVPAAEEGSNAELGRGSRQVRGAVSDDGSRVFFTATVKGGNHLFVRDVGLGKTVQVDVPVTGARGGQSAPVFQLATGDGSRLFFADEARLTTDATAKPGAPDLYMCVIGVTTGHLGCVLKDLSVDPHPGEAAAVVRGTVMGASTDGRYVYFAASGALANGAAHGECATDRRTVELSAESLCNLYVSDSVLDEVRLVGVVSNRDGNDWGVEGDQDLGHLTGRVSSNGRWFAFMSRRSLTGFDNRDVRGGEPDEEVFLYDQSTGGLRCVSCAASGARPAGVFDENVFPGLLVDRPQLWGEQRLAGSIPGWTSVDNAHALYQSRFLSDSGRLFFNSAVGLVAGDGNGKEDVYEFEPDGERGCAVVTGCVALISSGSSSEESAFLDASASGGDAFFMTAGKLVSDDTDNAFDVYDAHVCSAAMPCPSGVLSVPPACNTADSCRAAPAPQPGLFGAPASSTFSGAGNLKPTLSRPALKPLTRAQKLAKALKGCRKQPRRRRAACRAQALRRYGPLKKHTTARNNGRHN